MVKLKNINVLGHAKNIKNNNQHKFEACTIDNIEKRCGFWIFGFSATISSHEKLYDVAVSCEAARRRQIPRLELEELNTKPRENEQR